MINSALAIHGLSKLLYKKRTYIYMYSVYFSFNNSFRFILGPSLITLLAIISLSILFFRKKQDKENRISNLSMIVVFVISTIGSIGLWSSVFPDYLYYRNIYENKTYRIVGGQFYYITNDPHSYDAIQVDNVIFRNSPRQTTSAFQDYKKMTDQLGEGKSVRILYTSSYWIPQENAILRIEVKEEVLR